MVVVTAEHSNGLFFAQAHVHCDFCGAKSEPQGACGTGAKEHAIASARAHAKVTEKWVEAYEQVGKGRKAYALLRDKCPTCAAKTEARAA